MDEGRGEIDFLRWILHFTASEVTFEETPMTFFSSTFPIPIFLATKTRKLVLPLDTIKGTIRSTSVVI